MQINYYDEDTFLDMGAMLCEKAMNNRKSNDDIPIHMVFRAVKGYIENPGIMAVFWEWPIDKKVLREKFQEDFAYLANCLEDVRPWRDKDIAVFCKYNKDDPINVDMAMSTYQINDKIIFLRPISVIYLIRMLDVFINTNYRGRVYLLNMGIDIMEDVSDGHDPMKKFCLIGFEDLLDLAKFVDKATNYFIEDLNIPYPKMDKDEGIESLVREVLELEELDKKTKIITEEKETNGDGNI